MKKKRISGMILLLSALVCLSGCQWTDEKSEEVMVNESSEEENLISDPCKRPDGKAYQAAYLDYDPYITASKQLYYLLQAFIDMGWLEIDHLPFDEEHDAKDMIVKLADMDTGEYLQFRKNASYYIRDGEEKIRTELLSLVRKKELDLIIANGTEAGKLAKSLDLKIPVFIIGTTDPVGAGIIDSEEGYSGNDDIWAHVEPSLPRRQIQFYYSVKPFQKLGMIIYGDESISAIDDCEAMAEEIGFDLVKRNIKEFSRDGSDKEREEYRRILTAYINELIDEGIEAFLLSPNTFTSELASQCCDLFYDKGIPVYCMDEPVADKGPLMLIAANDFEHIGKFTADAIGKVLNGAVAGKLSRIYASSPSIYLNLDSAKKLGFQPGFQLLLSCDVIYSTSETSVR